jgi:hypothetical protein
LHADTPPRYLSCDTKKMEVQRYEQSQSRAKRADHCEPGTLINHCFGDFLSILSPPLKSKMIKICIVGRPCSYFGFAIYQLSPKWMVLKWDNF